MQSATIFFILVGLLVIFQETECGTAGKTLIAAIKAKKEADSTKNPGLLHPKELAPSPPPGWRAAVWYARKYLNSLCAVNTYLAYLPFLNWL
ncbi:unnamed protein product [Trichobilharzia szidati]|nr:unnamed protein product [Trichobilharzia szidati]